MIEVVQHKDFVLSSFQIAINRCQQAALDAAAEPIPCPEDQLALLKTKNRQVKSTSRIFACMGSNQTCELC